MRSARASTGSADQTGFNFAQRSLSRLLGDIRRNSLAAPPTRPSQADENVSRPSGLSREDGNRTARSSRVSTQAEAESGASPAHSSEDSSQTALSSRVSTQVDAEVGAPPGLSREDGSRTARNSRVSTQADAEAGAPPGFAREGDSLTARNSRVVSQANAEAGGPVGNRREDVSRPGRMSRVATQADAEANRRVGNPQNDARQPARASGVGTQAEANASWHGGDSGENAGWHAADAREDVDWHGRNSREDVGWHAGNARDDAGWHGGYSRENASWQGESSREDAGWNGGNSREDISWHGRDYRGVAHADADADWYAGHSREDVGRSARTSYVGTQDRADTSWHTGKTRDDASRYGADARDDVDWHGRSSREDGGWQAAGSHESVDWHGGYCRDDASWHAGDSWEDGSWQSGNSRRDVSRPGRASRVVAQAHEEGSQHAGSARDDGSRSARHSRVSYAAGDAAAVGTSRAAASAAVSEENRGASRSDGRRRSRRRSSLSQRPSDNDPATNVWREKLRSLLGVWCDQSGSKYTLQPGKDDTINVATTRPDGHEIISEGLIRIEWQESDGRIVWGRGGGKSVYILYGLELDSLTWWRYGSKDFKWKRDKVREEQTTGFVDSSRWYPQEATADRSPSRQEAASLSEPWRPKAPPKRFDNIVDPWWSKSPKADTTWEQKAGASSSSGGDAFEPRGEIAVAGEKLALAADAMSFDGSPPEIEEAHGFSQKATGATGSQESQAHDAVEEPKKAHCTVGKAAEKIARTPQDAGPDASPHRGSACSTEPVPGVVRGAWEWPMTRMEKLGRIIEVQEAWLEAEMGAVDCLMVDED